MSWVCIGMLISPRMSNPILSNPVHFTGFEPLDRDLNTACTANRAIIHETRRRFSGLANRSKLIVSELKSIDMMRDPFDYISQNLVNKDVVFTNADIYIGGGFDRVDPMVLSQQNIMYALTRHVDKEQKEKCDLTNLCTEKHYIGSHDMFLFHLTEPIPENALKHLEKGLISLGMENVFLWVFQNLLNYCTLNPCTILEMFHVHCSQVRNNKGKRVNYPGYSGRAPFTKKLVC